MALKGDRLELQHDISYFMNEVAEKGGVVSFSTGGSGAALDQSAALVTYAANSSGKKPLGILLNDMVNLDLTRQHVNQHKNEVQKGGKVTILRKGWVLTNFVNGSPGVGSGAYLTSSGYLQITQSAAGGEVCNPTVGTFISHVDEDGYAKVELKL